MRNTYYSRKTRHIVKFSSLIAASLLSCAASFADEDKTQVAIPSADPTNFVYNGTLQSYSIAENANYSVFGNTHTSAGSYEVTVVLSDPNYEWEDGTAEPKVFNFVISKMQVEIPLADTSHFVFNGEQQTYAIAESEIYSIDGFRKTNAGSHEVVVSLNDTVNYEWADATAADKKYSFAISKAQVEIPAADTNKYTYNGAILIYSIAPNPLYNISGNAQTNAGSHIVSVSLADAVDYQWADGTSEAKAFNFEIAKATVDLPVAKEDTFIYDGKVKLFEIAESNRYTVDITNQSAVSVGSYIRKVSINDAENYMWANGTEESKIVTFYIIEGKVVIPSETDFSYSGSTIALVPVSEGYTAENGEAINVGEYTVKMVLNDGYTWADGTKDTIYKTVRINPILVEKPNVNSAVVTYDSTIYSIVVPENPAYRISGQTMGLYPGDYTTTVALNPNYAWSDSTTEALNFVLSIERIKVAIPSADSSIYVYNQKMQTYEIEEKDLYTVSGNSQKEIGTYDVVVSLNDIAIYEWADKSTEPKHFLFNIIEGEKFSFETTAINTKVSAGETMTIDLNVNGTVQYYKIRCAEMPELADSLFEFNNETSTISIPTSSSMSPGKHIMNITLISGKNDTTITVDAVINYPASAIIVCWNDVIAVDNTKAKSTTYQWYKDGELIPGATGQYYCDKSGLCGYYMCELDGGITVGPAYMDFGKPLSLTAYGETGKIVANVTGTTNENLLLMNVGGVVVDSKPASDTVTFYVKPGIYVLAIEGTDMSIKVIVK